MPIEIVSGNDVTYHLVAFDAEGHERRDDPDGVMSHRVLERLNAEPITDAFVFSHGWLGDVPAARDQYRRWIAAMASCVGDLAALRQKRQGFQPLLVGLHWPSLPYGDDNLGAAAAFAAPSGTEAPEGDPVGAMVDEAAARIADTPVARAAIRAIVEAAMEDIAPMTLPLDIRAAYEILDRETGLGTGGPGNAPGDDREPFDPGRAYHLAQDEILSFGGSFGQGLLAPLRTLSFWKMKDRARRFGEGSAHQFMNDLRRQSDASGLPIRIHLMGHSFGCIVVSAMVCGPVSSTGASVDSMVMVQGALSLWSYCDDIPGMAERAGYFRRLLDGRVRGPIITTQSEFDSAVGRWYPLAAGVAHQTNFAPGELPKYGALGAFGAQGPGIDLVDAFLLDADRDYGFVPGKVYNLEGSRFIRRGSGFSGAHSDIDNPQVAHAVWQAVGA